MLDIGGKPMVVRVAEQAKLSEADEVLVATDHADIAAACREHGIDVMLTRADWPTGTDRLAEVVQARQWDDDSVIVNVQGDEPLIDPELVNLVAKTLIQGDQDIATCGHPIFDWAEFKQPNVVKIAMKENMEALYFSRAPIPFPRDGFSTEQLTERQKFAGIGIRHIGLYAYRARFLKTYQSLTPTALEELESLEQLRALAHGYRIKVCIIHESPLPGVDTQADLERVRSIFKTKLG